WEARFGAKHRLIAMPEKTLFLLVAPNGHQWEFHDFTCDRTDNAPPPGSLRRHVGPGGQETVIHYEYGRVDTVTRKCRLVHQSSQSEVVPNSAQSAVAQTGTQGQNVTETYLYEYIEEGDNKGRLLSITLYRNDPRIPLESRANLT